MSVETSVAPNLYQLGLEIGGSPSFRMVGPDETGVYRISSSVPDEQLAVAVAAHVADPEIQPEEPDPEPDPYAVYAAAIEAAQTLQEVRAAGAALRQALEAS